MTATTSPMMLQWETLKKSAPQAILFFRLGDFYEAFFDDALVISKELDLTLTKRQDTPMAGVPFHTCELYVDRLVSKGFHVAIAEQMEDARQTKGIVKREIVRIVTPGTLITSSLLPEKSNNFLVCLAEFNRFFGVSILDLTTAEFRVFEIEEKKTLLDELFCMRPAEVLVSDKFRKKHEDLIKALSLETGCSISTKEEWNFDHQGALDFLLRHFKLHTLDGFGLKGMHPATQASGALLRYVQEDLSLPISHIQKIHVQTSSQFMALDQATVHHLELFTSSSLEKNSPTLLSLLDQTSTPMGGRLLKQWLAHPLLSISHIQQRQQAVLALLQDQRLSQELNQVRDLERLIMRIQTGYATPRDLLGLALSLEPLPSIRESLSTLSSSLLAEQLQKLHDCTPLCTKIKNALSETPPLRVNEGGIFRDGYHQELDELRSLKGDARHWVATYQTTLREKTGIKTLKVGYTRAFGYYIEVSRGQSEKLAPFAQRRQTLVNAERFVTQELQEYEQKMLTADERILSLESELFHLLREEVAKAADAIRETAQALAVVDCLLAFSKLAREQNYTLPQLDESDVFYVEEGRHPVLEKALYPESFIANDLFLNGKNHRLLLITGPNMAGKSTYLRQTALIAILAQIGSFVPAKKAHIGLIDKVFCRIGASDDLSRGKSTFMVEMSETANILNNATAKSLVLLDEIGRGTSTYDGISIAKAVCEHLLSKGSKVLFATHYWELTKLEEEKEGAVNFHVAVHETKEGIVFLRKILKGSTDKSYGIHVARLAGLPTSVVRRAQELLISLEKEAYRAPPTPQLELFPRHPEKHPCLEELKHLDPNQLTPLQALAKLSEWKTKYDL
jgi:DNA mismatch repair protein MutS